MPGSSTVTCIAVATATTAASSADRYDRCADSVADWISAQPSTLCVM